MSNRSALVALLAVVALAAAAGWTFLHSPSNAGVAPLPSKSASARTEPVAAKELPPPAPAPAPELKPQRKSVNDKPAKSHGLFGSLFGGKEKAKKTEPEEEKKLAIDGVVVVTDSQGTEHREESGTLAPSFYDPPKNEKQKKNGVSSGRSWQSGDELKVAAGRFHVEVPPGHQFGAGKLVLGGRPAQMVGEPVDVVAGQVATLHARWIDGIPLRVVDATTKVELGDITVARPRERDFSTSSHPGAAASIETLADHAASPVTVLPQTGMFGVQMNDSVFVRAAGHAWTRVELNFELPGEKTVELGAAADLIVTLQGELPHRAPPAPSLEDLAMRVFEGETRHGMDRHDGAPTICLCEPTQAPSFDDAIKDALDHFDAAKPEDFPGGRKPTLGEFKEMLEKMRGAYEASRNVGTPHVIVPAVLGETHIESVEPGEFVVSVQIGEESQTPLIAGKAEVKLVAGETTRVTIVLAPVAAPEPVPLAGTLFVPAGWDSERMRLDIEPIDLPGKTRADERRIHLKEMVAIPGRPGWYHWSAGDVLPATWVFTVEGTGFSSALRVDPPGNEHLEFKLAEPATLVLHVVDAASGQPVKIEWLGFTPVRSGEWLVGGGSINFRYDEERARFSGAVPVGAGVITSFGDETWTLDEESTRVEIHAGEQEVTVRAHRLGGVIVALTCGGAKVAWPEDLGWQCEIESVDEKGHAASTSMRDDLPCVAVTLPGRYRVKLPEIPGYAKVEPFEVDVPAGEFVKRTVELTRK